MRPSKEPTADKWVLCRWKEDYIDTSVMLACIPRANDKDKLQRTGNYPLWYGLASRYPDWEVYRAKDGSDRWWIREIKYGGWRNILKDVPFLMVGAWYAHYMSQRTWAPIHFVYEETDHG